MRVERSHITSNLVNLLEAAGRLHRLLASILQVAPCPEIVPHAFAPLSPATARLLGSTSLRKHLGGHGEESLEPSPLPIDPETIDWLCRMVDRQRARAARDLKAAGLGAAQVRGRIERIQSKLRETEIRILASRERLERLRSRCLRLKAGHISRVGNRRKGLDGLERRISVYRGHLDQVRTAGRGERIRYKSGKGQRLDPMAVTLRRAELAELRTRLEAGRAELDREQAGLEKESARLERRMAAHERLRAQSVILRRYEATALQQEALDRSVLAAGTRRCRELDQARLDLDRAQALWLELKSGIRVWSELCVRLKALGRRVPNPDRTGARDRFDRIASELGNHLQAGDDRVPGLDALRRETAELLRVRTGQESRLRVLIEQAEQDAAAVYTPSYDPQSARPMADYLEAFRTLKEEAQRRRRLRADLESRLNEALAGVRDWETERRRLASELESAADILVSRSRGAAAQCAVLRHRADRLRLRLGEVRAGLAPLIGEPAFLEDNLLTGAVQLAEAGRNLDTLRDRLRASHDRVTVDLEAVLSKPDPAVFASLETDLVRLRSASDGYTSLVGLKKQIETLARVRNQAIRIRGLEAGRRRDRAELLRLGAREKRLGLSLNQTRHRLERLRAERSRLTEELASARSRATGLARHFNDDIYPLIRVLALALERGKARNEALEADNRTLSGEIVQLAEKSRRTEEAAGLLSRSVTRLRQVLNRRESEMGILRGRSKAMSDRLEAQESLAGDFEALARHRGRQVQTLQDQLADLYPLLEFFIDQVRLWTGPPRREQETVTALPEGSDLLVLMVHMLGYENENLRTKLGVIEDERRLWVFENEHLSRSHDLMKSRLETLQPLLAFFWQAWFTNTSALADAHHQLGRLTRQSSDLQAEKAGLENRIARLRAGLGETRQSLALTEAALEKSESGLLASQLDRTELRESLARMTDRAEALERSGARAARESEARGARLKSLLKDHASLRSRFSQTDADRESFRSLAVARGAEIRTLRTQLEARTGQVEAAWVGASHIAARSAEALSGLQAELEDRTRLLEERETELARFRRRVDELEAGQDRLGLLLWTIARYGGDNQAVWEALVELNRDKGFKDAAVIAAARLAELTAAGAAKIRSDQFRRAARQTVRRGLYSLLLAGGMVFALPEEPSIATALLEDPAGRERMVENLGGQLRMEPVPAPDTVYSPLVGRPFDASFARPWDRARGTERIEALVRDEISALARQVGLEPREYIGYLRRQFKPGQTVRLPKLMDLRNAFEHLDGEFPYISYDFRGAYPELTQVQTLYALARSADSAECHFWDRLYGDYRLLGADPSICLNMILANANRYAAWRDHRPDVAFVGRLKPIPELEKAGPARFLRIMVPYIKAHVRAITSNEIYAYAHKPDQIDEYARRFAEDLYVASKAFGVPLTLMVAISHQESYFANVLGDRSRSASPFQIWEPTKPFILSQMDKQGIQVPGVPKRLQDHLTLATYMAAFYLGQLIEQHTVAAPKDGPPRCNLARVALSYNGGQAYPGAVERKQQRLSAYLDRLAPKAPDEPKPKNGA